MKCEKIYNHLNAEEYLLLRCPDSWNELLDTIKRIDANRFLKYSKDKVKKGEILYSQSDINDEFELELFPKGWKSQKTPYYVSDNIATTRELVKLNDKAKQKDYLDERGEKGMETFNQVDFVKNGIAVEVQFGKYFSVAYDLHVKHTFFYSLGEINVGVEIIPTHEFQLRMDTGVSWWENEVANVIREGRSNPSVPIVIIGIEPDELIPLPDKNSATKLEKALRDKESAEAKLNEIIAKIPEIEEQIRNERRAAAKEKLQAKLSKIREAVGKQQEKVRNLTDVYNDALTKHNTLEAFKEAAANTITELDEARKGRKDTIKEITQRLGREERIADEAEDGEDDIEE